MPEKCICIECGKEFTVRPYKKDIARFCSNECRNKNKRVKGQVNGLLKLAPVVVKNLKV